MKRINYSLIFLLLTVAAFGQKPYLSDLKADKHSPLYSTYAAPVQRSAFALDEGYQFQFYADSLGADFITDTGGDIGIEFELDHKRVYKVQDMYKAPVITSSYPDMVKYEFYPFKGIKAEAFFVVHSSTAALLNIKLNNQTQGKVTVKVVPFIRNSRHAFTKVKLKDNQIGFDHVERPDGWTTEHKLPFTDSIRNVFLLSAQPDISGSFKEGRIQPLGKGDSSTVLAFSKVLHIGQGKSNEIRIVRAVSAQNDISGKMIREANMLIGRSLASYATDNEKLFEKTPVPRFADPDRTALYWSANNMMRQVFYPAEGKSKYNYYVFSREPTWGWGHGGQVFHESIAMLAYAYIDPVSAMNSQRVYLQRQYPNGYINYRTGSYLDEIIEYKGQLTSSAPWYSWLNWEVYQITKDERFLKEMYGSSKKFYEFYVSNRDTDHDGLCEWGGEAILESVRDALVAVWDKVGYPANFESLDLNCMLVVEAKSLEAMANKLGLREEALRWKADHEKRTALINSTFWDEENGFYYNVDKKTHQFTFKEKNDLKRDEIIGFLPLWAGIADKERAARLVKKLTDQEEFWRPYGVPSLSAKDSYYNAKGYWNGPVWVEWNYLIMRGLIDYGYRAEAKELVDRVANGMTGVLKKDHNLWEFYSPDEVWGGYHRTYIWAGIINRMMLDTSKL